MAVVKQLPISRRQRATQKNFTERLAEENVNETTNVKTKTIFILILNL